jgi:predicted GNAT family acetyltransferase
VIEFRNAPDKYELLDDGTVIGVSVYRDSGARRVFTHTEIDGEYAGRGLASQLVKFALDDARTRGLHVIPRCPMVAAFIGKHPEYADLVDEVRGVDERATK